MTPAQRAGATLGLCVAAAVLLLALTHHLTRERIERTQRLTLLNSLSELLPGGPFDNDPLSSSRQMQSQDLEGGSLLDIYTVHRQGDPYAAVLRLHTRRGYNGRIELLLGLSASGSITGARVLEHAETPGLGDDIELRHSDWILSFNGLNPATLAPTDWSVRQYGGRFDAFTGATITPAAVIDIIYQAHAWFMQHRHEVFSS